MYLTLLLVIIFVATLILLGKAGLWSNTITLVNVITAALLASSLGDALATWLNRQSPSYTYFWDFLSLWLIFIIAVSVLRVATDALSKVKVRFRLPVNLAGGILMACWTGWVMVCFTLMTLHTAPLSRNFLAGEFQPQPQDRMFFGFAPDRQWLGFVYKESAGALYRGGPKDQPRAYQFDPQGEFILKYSQRRANFEREPESRVRSGVR